MADSDVSHSKPDTTHILRPLPPLVLDALHKREIPPDDIIVATDTDLDIAGEYSESWVVVTKELVCVFFIDEEEHEALLLKDIPIESIETARTDTRVGSGFLEVKMNDVFEELARFSNKNAEKFAKVAQRLKSLAEGKHVVAEPEEEVVKGRCEKCGCILPDKHMKICPKCLKRGMVFLRFLKRVRTYWPHALAAFGLVLLTAWLVTLPPQFTRVLVDNVLTAQPKELPPWFNRVATFIGYNTAEGFDAETGVYTDLAAEIRYQWLYILVGGLVAATALGALVGFLRETLAVWISNRLAFELRQEVFRKLEDMSVRYHDTHPVGQLMQRCSQDIETLQTFIVQLTSGFGYQLILVSVVAVFMFTLNWKLALVAIVPAPFVMLSTVVYYRRIVPGYRKFWTTRSSLSNILHGTLNGIRVVKAFAQEGREAHRFDEYSLRYRDAALNVGFATARFYPAVGFVFQIGSFFIWFFGGLAVIHSLDPTAVRELTLGELIAFIGYLAMFYGPLNSLTQMSTWFTSFTTQAHRVFEVLDETPEIEEATDAVDVEIQGSVAFRNVVFGYDPHIPVLHDVSFRVQPGEMVGIVGHSGSGKSTTVNLIMRFYDPQEGEVTIDNIDVQKIRQLCLRRQIGIVAQDPFLFRGTIAENIAYGNPKVAPQQILNAALAANAHMFITRIHDGYDTRLGERGSGLSGGERQRVAIARALIQNPRILILDEATSSVDTIAECEIQKALEALSLGRTTIAIAHRLSTLRNCDRILVFEEGLIREHGTHEELLAQNGIYKRLVEIQTQLSSGSVGTMPDFKAIEQMRDEAQKTAEAKREERKRLEIPHIRYLNPKKLHIYSMDEGGMQVRYGEEVYDHVRAYRAFPVSRPSEFIALWTGSSAFEHKEIGMVRRLKELAPSSRLAVEHELAKRYFIHYVQKIVSIKEEMGFLTWNVETDKGNMEFLTKRFERDTVVEGPVNGRIIFDVDNNRYEIEDLDTIDAASKATFLKYIYW
ncbi:MAG: DUF1854 domain-containing protein [Candidatus Hydrogenedentes bacterium]|nr:DUF1854 domain-containing protein [Candidatus Hydrogenedentota bacterium]